ncbi:MAG: AAA family ATPase [Fimbriimonadales bacterium]
MRSKLSTNTGHFLLSVQLNLKRQIDFDLFPFCLPVVRHMKVVKFHPKVTYFVGENGTGKSTLLEAIAVAAGFNAEGGSKNFNFSTRRTHSPLDEYIMLARSPDREKTGYFLRAESFYNVATTIDQLDEDPDNSGSWPPIKASYGGKSLHEQSHGESFLSLVQHRFGPNGLYILDEPEAALSPARQLSVLLRIHELAEESNCQFIIATHSPLLMAYPGATMYSLSPDGIESVDWRETEHYKMTKSFLDRPEVFLHHLLGGDPSR